MDMSTKLTATNFQNPLLRVLGKLSNFTAGAPVVGKDTYEPVMALMGIADINEHGENEASKQPQVAKWIQWANTNLRKSGLTAAPPKSRGKWTLTAKGVAEARKLAEAAGETTPQTPDPATVQASSAMAAPKAQTDGTPRLVMPPEDGVYHPDTYVRSLAIGCTPCFGKYSEHGKAVCSDCPLSGECRNRKWASFSSLAAQLAVEDAAGTAPAATTPAAAPAATTPAAPAAGTSRWAGKIDFSQVDAIRNHSDALCAECGKAIPKGERCRWVEELPGSDDGGLFHMDCSGGE